MIARVYSFGLYGIDGFLVQVEVDISTGLPSFEIVGLPDASVRESKERVRSAIKNCGFEIPTKKITVNLAPAKFKKEGPSFDLPIAIAILLAAKEIQAEGIRDYLLLGELSLDGRLRSINGVLPMVLAAKKSGIKKVIVPRINALEAAVVDGIEVYGARTLSDIIRHLKAGSGLDLFQVDMQQLFLNNDQFPLDFEDVRGQQSAKRAVEVAVAGGHNILLIGSPGSGKSMIAQRIPSILPDFTFEEALESTKIHSVAGQLRNGESLLSRRPFRSPHHTISSVALAGGGSIPKPGELSLAHNGVLFLDELPEFRRDALEVMRQPLEDGKVTISRVNGTLSYPCNTLFVASMNPCPCGYYGDDNRECSCTPNMIRRYLSRISGPLLDRIDLHIEVSSVQYDQLADSNKEEGSAAIRERVNRARKIQRARYKGTGIFSNSQLTASMLRQFCPLSEDAGRILKMAFENLGLSARARDRILKVARTAADLAGEEAISAAHIAEAVQYRSLDRKFWHSL